MEKLTELRFEGSDHVQAWCDTCKEWIEQVGLSKDCNTQQGKKDIIFCLECNTAIIRSE